MAAAREAQGINYVKGDGIFCEKRFREDMTHMIEFLITEGQSALGRKGEYCRRFLTEEEYRDMLELAGQGKLQIKKHAEVKESALRYLPIPVP